VRATDDWSADDADEHGWDDIRRFVQSYKPTRDPGSPIVADDLGVQVRGENYPRQVGDEEPERGTIDVAGVICG